MWILCWFHPRFHPNPALTRHYHQLAGIGQPLGTQLQRVECLVVLSHRNRGGKHFTFGKHSAGQLLAAEWGTVTLFVFNLEEPCPVHVYHLDELCPVFSWFCPIKMEGLCPDGHCGASRLWCLIQSVPKRNRGEKPTIHKGPFSKKEDIEHPRKTEMPMRERWPRTSPRRLRQICRKVCELTLLTGWANSVTIYKYKGHGLFLSQYHCISAGLLE